MKTFYRPLGVVLNRSTWKSVGHPLVSAPPCALDHLPVEGSDFNLRVDAMQPLLRPVGSLLISGEFRLKLRDPVFSRAQLMRKLLRRA